MFALVSIVGFAYSLYAGFSKGNPVRSKLYGYPIARIGAIYMAAQLAFSILCMILAAVIPWWLSVLVSVVMFGVASIGLIAVGAVREEIERQDKKIVKDVSFMRSVQSKVRMIASNCKGKPCEYAITKLSDELQYSDPVSSDVLQNIEYELAEIINEIQKSASDTDYESVSQLSDKAISILSERNRLCKLNKKF